MFLENQRSWRRSVGPDVHAHLCFISRIWGNAYLSLGATVVLWGMIQYLSPLVILFLIVLDFFSENTTSLDAEICVVGKKDIFDISQLDGGCIFDSAGPRFFYFIR